jgi:ATP-binding cassette, subfamily G (WHITE), eye pigment precursor transporter
MYRLSGFVHQDDIFIGTLTVYEHLNFMANLKLDRRVTAKTKQTTIRDILEQTGLKKCMHTQIGEDGEGKMLSGGEKKRLAFATELLTQPVILFCDEPTTGLDSFSAQQLVGTLQRLATQGTTIICELHFWIPYSVELLLQNFVCQTISKIILLRCQILSLKN